MKLAKKEYVDSRIFELTCNIKNQGSFTHTSLKNLKKIECEFSNTKNEWHVIVPSFGGYALNTYKSIDIGLIYDKNLGKVTFQYSSNLGEIDSITKIIGYR